MQYKLLQAAAPLHSITKRFSLQQSARGSTENEDNYSITYLFQVLTLYL